MPILLPYKDQLCLLDLSDNSQILGQYCLVLIKVYSQLEYMSPKMRKDYRIWRLCINLIKNFDL